VSRASRGERLRLRRHRASGGAASDLAVARLGSGRSPRHDRRPRRRYRRSSGLIPRPRPRSRLLWAGQRHRVRFVPIPSSADLIFSNNVTGHDHPAGHGGPRLRGRRGAPERDARQRHAFAHPRLRRRDAPAAGLGGARPGLGVDGARHGTRSRVAAAPDAPGHGRRHRHLAAGRRPLVGRGSIAATTHRCRRRPRRRAHRRHPHAGVDRVVLHARRSIAGVGNAGAPRPGAVCWAARRAAFTDARVRRARRPRRQAGPRRPDAHGENFGDRNYRLHGSGVDEPGLNVAARLRARF
jgi:hypothetical protein